MRLNKYLADSGIASRRAADVLIEEGRVIVNGQKASLGGQIDPDKDRVEVAGKLVGKAEKKIYLLLHKPKGVVSTVRDSHGRPTVLDLVTVKERVFPVGRLDADSSGLILLTNDGGLAYRLTHPKFEIDKKYIVTAIGSISEEQLKKLRQGVRLDDGKTARAEVGKSVIVGGRSLLEMSIHEGRKRQIRRMCEAVKVNLVELQRVKMGTLELGTLSPGQWRALTEAEVASLKTLVA